MLNLCNALLPNDTVHSIAADIDKIIKPTPRIDKLVEIDVAPKITIVSTDSKFVLRVL